MSSFFGNAKLYAGRELDGETGLYHLRHRQYDPAIGRFITRDPLDAGVFVGGCSRSVPVPADSWRNQHG